MQKDQAGEGENEDDCDFCKKSSITDDEKDNFAVTKETEVKDRNA
jgi:hypothetical protein